MQKDVLRGMLEAKEMLRDLWGTKNVYTYGVAGTGLVRPRLCAFADLAGRQGRGLSQRDFLRGNVTLTRIALRLLAD